MAQPQSAARPPEARRRNVADFIVERLVWWKIDRVFGYSGDGINGVIGALDRAQDRLRFIQAPHEELASLMACAHAKFTGEVGVCLSTAGPGAVHLLNGLYDAKSDHQPVVAIVGQQGTSARGSSYQQDIDLRSVLKDVGSAYIEEILNPEQAGHVIDRAFRTALEQRTVTVIIVPHDVQILDAPGDTSRGHGRIHTEPGFASTRPVPTSDANQRAAELLNACERPAILAGAGALNAGEALEAVAERLGAGIAKALLGKAVVPDDHPAVTGSVGWLGTLASNRMMQECDGLLIVGSGMPYTEFLPALGNARTVQIDLFPSQLGLRYPIDVPLAGDAAETLATLLAALAERDRSDWRDRVTTLIGESNAQLAGQAAAPANPLNPQLVVRKLSDRLPDDAIVTGDSGTAAVWLARHVQLRRGMKFSLSGTWATMGCALPYAFAAKLAFPDRPAVAVVGDGAMQMSGVSMLFAIGREWKRWADPRLVTVVLNNRDLSYVTWEQRAVEGEPKFPASQELPDFAYGEYAAMFALGGMRLESVDQLDAVLDQAMAADRPFVIDAVVDGNVPTLPPELPPSVKDRLREALAAGDPDAGPVAEQLALQGYQV